MFGERPAQSARTTESAAATLQLKLVVSATGLIAATYGMARFAYGFFVPQFTATFSLTSVTSGIISSGSFFSYCIAATLAYVLAQRDAAVTNVILAGGAAGAGCLGVALSQSATQLAGSILVAGAGAGFASPGLVALIAHTTEGLQHNRYQSIVNAGTGFGVLFAGPIALAANTHWRLAWIVYGAAAISSAALSIRYSHRRTPKPNPRPHRSPRLALTGFAIPTGCAIAVGFGSAATWTFGRSLVVDIGHLSSWQSTVYWSLLGAAGIGGALAGDIVANLGTTTSWLFLSTTLAASTLALSLIPGNVVAATVTGMLFGASYVALCGVLIVWAIQINPSAAAAGTAVLFIALAAGQVVGASVVGAFIDETSETTGFAIASLVAFAGGVGAMFKSQQNIARTRGT